MQLIDQTEDVKDVPPCPRCGEQRAIEVRRWPDYGNGYRGQVCCCRCRILYAFEPNYEHLDASDLACPHCGCSDVQVTRWPGQGGWWARTAGKAVCQNCRREFRVNYVPNEEH